MSLKGLEAQRNTPLNTKLKEIFWGAWCMQTNWNYERQMNTAYMYAMSHTIDRLYPEEDEIEKKKEAYRRHLEFFNITPQCAALTLGISAAMEEEYAADPENFDPAVINSVKVALMGPLSGIGDSLFQGTIRIIAMSIGISLAQQGNILGPILAALISIFTSAPITWYLGKLGYTRGQEFVRQMSESNLMEKVMFVCSIAGLFVIGGMSATLSNLTTPLAFGESFVLQNVIDGILPKAIPLGMTWLMYYIVKSGKVKPMTVIIGCFIAGIILNYFGILAA
ncbi:MAG: PTS system mannose/fructose/sorbose family transporter subunit IID [Solobacterium sp.]|nr:PTS system mannose/fructose/sorbose family transporter subunit IID [Solobacterium sp.]